jgi:hypothetical protein
MSEEEFLSSLLKQEIAKHNTTSTRSSPRKRSKALVSYQQYERGRLAISELAGISIWFLLWLLNGYFTVVYLNALGDMIIGKHYSSLINSGVHFVGGILATTAVGWFIHVVGSLVEGVSWRNIKQGVGLTFLLVALADVITTTLGLLNIAQVQGAAQTIVSTILIAVGAIILALLPEMMIIKHLQQLGVIGAKHA